MKSKTAAILVCAGSGARMKQACDDKLMLELCGKPVAAHTIFAFDYADGIDLIVVVARKDMVSIYQEFPARYGIKTPMIVVCGGNTRMESVLNGVRSVPETYDYVAISDGARPLVRTEDIEKTLKKAMETGAAALGAWVTDTTKEVVDGEIVRTIPRERLVSIQTPQIFCRMEYMELAHKALDTGKEFTDDASIYEAFGRTVSFVDGHRDNWKITAPEDIALITKLLEERL